ncbi:MAG: four helix bundle suffix domain-containing protein [Paludibacteraceae bacterium]
MIDPKKVQLQHYADGTPSVLRKTVVYQELYFYKRSDILYQLTVAFCRRFLPKYGDRTVDQMVQAARSTMQNIAEGSVDGQTSVETEIKLLGVAKGSNHELLGDYQNYIKTNGLSEWWGTNSRADKLHLFCKEHTSAEDFSPYLERWTDEEMANCAICLCHMIDRGLTTYIANKDREFVEQGGIRERMTAARVGYRNNQKEEIERLQAELAEARAEIARLKAELSGKFR